MKDKILNNVVVSESGCWEWQLSGIPNGYGRVYHSGNRELAHRYSYRAFHGEIPEGCVVMHSCDNRKCCNPEHLSAGSPSSNMLDMVTKGRHRPPDNRGESHGLAKLTVTEVVAIFKDNRKQSDIASAYGVTKATVSAIKGGKRWRHVTSTLVNTK